MISVVMASLNSGAFVERAVRSALDQPGIDLEVLVQDGGSSDGTLAKLERLRDPRLLVESCSDDGQAAALNRAIGRSSGEWIVWLNADDVLATGALEFALQSSSQPYDVVVGDFETIDELDRTVKLHRTDELDRRQLLRRGCYAFSGAVFIRRSVFDAHGLLDPGLHFAMDYEYFLRIAPHVRCVHLDRTLASYRIHPSTKSSTMRWSTFREAGALRREYARSMDSPSKWQLGQVKLALYYLSRSVWTSERWLRRGEVDIVAEGNGKGGSE